MLSPEQFEVNEAWIVFQLNYDPIPTEIDGEIDCFALMDAASLFILGSIFLKSGSLNSSIDEIHQLLQSAYSHKAEWPKKLLVPKVLKATQVESEAESRDITVVPVTKGDIAVFTREACQAFKAHLSRGS
jgi:hypothetical protein